MIKLIRLMKSNKAGASAAEYALILAVLGGVIVAGLQIVGSGINSAFKSANSRLTSNY